MQGLRPNYNPDSPTSDLARLYKSQLVTGGLTKSDDKPESYLNWKSIGKYIKDLVLTARQEVTLLIKCLGPESSLLAKRLKAITIRYSPPGLTMIWLRLCHEKWIFAWFAPTWPMRSSCPSTFNKKYTEIFEKGQAKARNDQSFTAMFNTTIVNHSSIYRLSKPTGDYNCRLSFTVHKTDVPSEVKEKKQQVKSLQEM
ncbi:unnamed protein product [Menidia menidia]|uniref:(Atlantic silverside) hypothetical protein n=1 Tax=Menidia menidia TaxID=238744 RepID=A0A8S4BJT5_9TELE|nr:unnamed protein product [Menidia menidia]